MTVLKEGLRDRISPSCTLSQNGYGDCRTVWGLANVTESMSWSNSERARVRAWAKGRKDRRCHMQCAHVGVGGGRWSGEVVVVVCLCVCVCVCVCVRVFVCVWGGVAVVVGAQMSSTVCT